MLSGTGIPRCPISIEEIQNPATTPCGHTFEQKEINDWINKKEADCACPVCNAKIAGLTLAVDIQKRDMFQQIRTLLGQLKAQSQLIEQLRLEEKKDDVRPGRIPVEQEVLLNQNKSNAQHIATSTMNQATLFIGKRILGNYIRNHALLLKDANSGIKQRKRATLGMHTTTQDQLKTSLTERTQQFNPANMLNNVQDDPLQICKDMERLTDEMATDIQNARQEVNSLRIIFQKQVTLPTVILSKYLGMWMSLNKKIKESAEHLKNLRAIEQQTLRETLAVSRDSTDKTLSLFGGNGIKPTATAEQNAQLLAAVKSRDIKKVRELLLAEHQFNLELRDQANSTLLYIAMLNKDFDMMDLLIAKKADVKAFVNFANSKSPLLITAIADIFSDEESFTMVRKLLLAGADVNAVTTTFLNTALHWAASRGSANIVLLLLEFRASVTLTNNLKKTPLDIAKGNKCIALLKQAALPSAPAALQSDPIPPPGAASSAEVKIHRI